MHSTKHTNVVWFCTSQRAIEWIKKYHAQLAGKDNTMIQYATNMAGMSDWTICMYPVSDDHKIMCAWGLAKGSCPLYFHSSSIIVRLNSKHVAQQIHHRAV